MRKLTVRGSAPLKASWTSEFTGIIAELNESTNGGAIFCTIKEVDRPHVLSAYELANACDKAKIGLISSTPGEKAGEFIYEFDAEKLEGLQIACKKGPITLQKSVPAGVKRDSSTKV